MRKVLLLALVSMFFVTACNKSEETAPAPDAAASAAAPAAMRAAAAMAASAGPASRKSRRCGQPGCAVIHFVS